MTPCTCQKIDRQARPLGLSFDTRPLAPWRGSSHGFFRWYRIHFHSTYFDSFVLNVGRGCNGLSNRNTIGTSHALSSYFIGFSSSIILPHVGHTLGIVIPHILKFSLSISNTVFLILSSLLILRTHSSMSCASSGS